VDLRVRDRGDQASIEVTQALLAGPLGEGTPLAEAVCAAVVDAGFARAGLDPLGFRSGSLNEELDATRWQ
jgi:uncharacterized protein